ncbi:MAG: hypothetical protein Kilf2KO_04000 [Rhodospirillales bacterium]
MAEETEAKAGSKEPNQVDVEAASGIESNGKPGLVAKSIDKYRRFSDLERGGIFVFCIASFALITFLVLASFVHEDSQFQPYRYLRASEILLTLAATSLVVAIIGRAENPFVLVFGILLIGALIVPSGDIVRFALIASGSDSAHENSTVTRSGTDLGGRSTDVASKILAELSRIDSMQTLTDAKRKVAIDVISSKVQEEREITLLEQVRARGALQVLEATERDMEQWIYKYGNDNRFLEDLRYLRSEDLLSIVYDDLQSIRITNLGRTVLDRARRERAGSRDTVTANTSVDDGSVECPRETQTATQITEVAGSIPDTVVYLTSEFEFFSLRLVESREYQITLDAIAVTNETRQDSINVDPLIYIMVALENNRCLNLQSNDDYGDTLNAQMTVNLSEGNYFIGVTSIGAEGNASLSFSEIRI